MNDGKRQKGTRELIEDIFEVHPDWNASQIHERYLILLGDANKAVGLNAIQKHLEEIKPRYQEILKTGLDEPWHMGVLNNKDIAIDAEAVPYILLLQTWAEKAQDEFVKQPFTIRQAIWLSKLRCVVELSKMKPKELVKIAQFLWHWSKAYAQREIGCHLRGIPFDTVELDKSLRVGANARVVGKSILIFYKDGSFLIDTA